MGVTYDQHFMVDRQLLEYIVTAASIKKTDTVLEIGAGDGRLTRLLAATAGKVIAVEIDRTLLIQAPSNVKVVQGNILQLLDSLPFTKIVSNLPYAISEPLLRKLAYREFAVAVLTLPQPFVFRLLNQDTTFSLFCRAFFEIAVLAGIPRMSFEPQPHTSSVLVRITKKERSAENIFLSMETKKVKNALCDAFSRMKRLTKKQAEDMLKSLEINNELQQKTIGMLTAGEMKTLVRLIKGVGQ